MGDVIHLHPVIRLRQDDEGWHVEVEPAPQGVPPAKTFWNAKLACDYANWLADEHGLPVLVDESAGKWFMPA